MHLMRDGEKLSGTYLYAAIGKPLTLVGTATNGEFTLQETVDGKGTGEFKGTLGPDGAFSGTWSTPTGDKKLLFQFNESSEPFPTPTANAAAGKPAPGKPVEPATVDVIADFLVKVAKTNGTTVSHEEAAKDYDGFSKSEYAKGGVETKLSFEKKYRFEGFNSAGVSLYVADINNDGKTDYALTDVNSVSTHNNRLVEVYTDKGDRLEHVAIPKGAPLVGLYHFAASFISIDAEGTTMHFQELKSDPKAPPPGLALGKVARYIWKDGKIKLLEKT